MDIRILIHEKILVEVDLLFFPGKMLCAPSPAVSGGKQLDGVDAGGWGLHPLKSPRDTITLSTDFHK
jgi:hypothetical protein